MIAALIYKVLKYYKKIWHEFYHQSEFLVWREKSCSYLLYSFFVIGIDKSKKIFIPP